MTDLKAEVHKSEIYTQGYEKWEGDRAHHFPVWFLMGKTVLRNVVTPGGCLSRLLLIFGFVVPLAIYFFFAFISTLVLYQGESLKDYALFRVAWDFVQQTGINLKSVVQSYVLGPSMIFIPLFMVFYGSQLISKDKAANAMQVYFSKAISRTDYVLGKLFAVGVFTAITSLFPGAMILICGLLFTNDHVQYLADAWYLPILIVVFWLMLTLVYGAITLLFSSFFNKSYMAAVAIVAFPMFCTVFSALLTAIFGSSGLFEGLNWYWSFWVLGSALFSLEVDSWSVIIWRAMDLVLISSIAFYMIYGKIKPVEVVS